MIEFRAASDGNDTTELLCYGDIGDSMWAEVGASEFAKQLQDVKTPKLRLRINSIGGSVFAGLAIYNSLKAWPGEIEVRIDGLAASIASVVAMAGKTIVMPANAMMMVHKPWCAVAGNSDDLRKTADTLDQLINSLAGIYSARTGQTDETVRQLMQDETWLDAESAKALGFADEVVPDAVSAKLDGELINVAGQVFLSATVPQFAQILARMCPPAVSGGLAHDILLEDKPMETKTDPIPVAQVIDTKAIEAAASELEQTRVLTILASAKKIGVPEAVARKLITDKVTLAEAGLKLIEAAAGAEPVISGLNAVTMGMDAIDHQVKGMEVALLHRYSPRGELPEIGRPFHGDSLMDMARVSLENSGVRTRGMSRLEVASRALRPMAAGQHSTSDFPFVLANVANKSMMRGYTESPRTFLPFCVQRNLPDFKDATGVSLGEIPTLADVAEGGEYHCITIGERREVWHLTKSGSIFAITSEALINDDMNAFTRLPQLYGAAAARKQSDVVYAIFTGNPNMGDGVPLFNFASHANMAQGADIDPPNASTIAAMQSILAAQFGVDGVTIVGAQAKFILVPMALNFTTRQLLGTNYMPTSAATAVTDEQRGLTIIAEPRLDLNSLAEWFVICDPSQMDTIEYGFLQGQEGPQLTREEGFEIDGMKLKCSQIFGAKAMDWRGMAENAGT